MKSTALVIRLTYLICTLLLSFSTQAEWGYEEPTLDWMPKGIDWSQAKEVRIILEDHVFTPDEMVFEKNKPYKLVLENISRSARHDLVESLFFHSIVLDKITIGGISINTPHIHSILLRPESNATIWMVPIKAAEFDVFCSVPGHREEGMEGIFIVR